MQQNNTNGGQAVKQLQEQEESKGDLNIWTLHPLYSNHIPDPN